MISLKEFKAIVKRDEPLALHTYFRLGGPAECFVEPRSVDELSAVVRRALDEETPLRILGGGSNILVRDEGVPGVVVQLSAKEFTDVSVERNVAKAGAGALLSNLISRSVRERLAGLETLVGIPGSVGGALRGNAGGRAGDIGQFVSSVTVLDRQGEPQVRDRDELSFAYRESNLDDPVILSADFELEPDNPDVLVKRMRKLWIMKKAGQPLSFQSAGCIFKNPRGLSAGLLIDQAGLKGARVGGAEVSDRHANFIVAHEGATATDVLKLIDHTRSRVAERFGVELELEIKVW